MCKPFESYPLENNSNFNSNFNNFPTLQMCLGYCTASKILKNFNILANHPEEAIESNVCSLPLSGSMNSGSIPNNAINVFRYYFDNTEKKCKSFKFSGINGNGNNFKSKRLCNFICDSTSKDNEDDHSINL